MAKSVFQVHGIDGHGKVVVAPAGSPLAAAAVLQQAQALPRRALHQYTMNLLAPADGPQAAVIGGAPEVRSSPGAERGACSACAPSMSDVSLARPVLGGPQKLLADA